MKNYIVFTFLFLFIVCLISGTIYYFYREKMIARREEKSGFRASLLQQLRKRKASFDFYQLIEEEEVSESLAYEVALELYTKSCEQALADGIITEAERNSLNQLSTLLTITPQDVRKIEKKLTYSRYRQAAIDALADGTITPAESSDLARLRSQLGLNEHQASAVVGVVALDGYLALFRRVISDGRITLSEQEELARYRQALNISREKANSLVRDDALQLYRQWFYGVIQDGEVTPEEEQSLKWLQQEFDLSDADVRKYQEQIDEIKYLDACRKGQLPSVQTRHLLEGGEICHWEGRCDFEWETQTSVKKAEGDLIITSERVIFISSTRGFTFSPSKIMDIRLYNNALVIKCTSNRGGGSYFVKNPRELEAVLIGIAKRHKYQSSANYDSTMTRHIPDAVRREVWARDGGKCVRCAATDYLEFDHIIPHTKGGANSVNNVQLLCRRCNNLKSDRI